MNIGESASHDRSGALSLTDMPVILSVKHATGENEKRCSADCSYGSLRNDPCLEAFWFCLAVAAARQNNSGSYRAAPAR